MYKVFILCSVLLTPFIAIAGDLEDGNLSYGRGEYDAARASWLKVAPSDPVAQHSIGRMYFLGQGVQQDYKQAADWYRRSADRGYAMAQHELSALYLLGLGVSRDFSESEKLQRKAAVQRYAYAQYDLAGLYVRGYGVPKELVLAYVWYDLAFESSQGTIPSLNRNAMDMRDQMAKQLTAERLAIARDLLSRCRHIDLNTCIPFEISGDSNR